MVIISSIIPTYTYVINAIEYSESNDNIAFFDDNEYKAATWISENIDSNAIIISDPMTQLIIASLSDKINIAEGHNSYAISLTKKMFTAENPHEAYNLTNKIINSTLSNNNYDGYYYSFYGQLPSQDDKILIILSGRTVNWINNPKARHPIYLWRSNNFPGKFNPYSGFENFYDKTHFVHLYENEGVHIFEVRQITGY